MGGVSAQTAACARPGPRAGSCALGSSRSPRPAGRGKPRTRRSLQVPRTAQGRLGPGAAGPAGRGLAAPAIAVSTSLDSDTGRAGRADSGQRGRAGRADSGRQPIRDAKHRSGPIRSSTPQSPRPCRQALEGGGKHIRATNRHHHRHRRRHHHHTTTAATTTTTTTSNAESGPDLPPAGAPKFQCST